MQTCLCLVWNGPSWRWIFRGGPSQPLTPAMQNQSAELSHLCNMVSMQFVTYRTFWSLTRNIPTTGIGASRTTAWKVVSQESLVLARLLPTIEGANYATRFLSDLCLKFFFLSSLPAASPLRSAPTALKLQVLSNDHMCSTGTCSLDLLYGHHQMRALNLSFLITILWVFSLSFISFLCLF